MASVAVKNLTSSALSVEVAPRMSIVIEPGAIKTPIWERSEVRGVLANGRAKMLQRIAERKQQFLENLPDNAPGQMKALQDYEFLNPGRRS